MPNLTLEKTKSVSDEFDRGRTRGAQVEDSLLPACREQKDSMYSSPSLSRAAARGARGSVPASARVRPACVRSLANAHIGVMLRYTESLYTALELGELKAELLERGYVILPRVYQRHTVPAVSENHARGTCTPRSVEPCSNLSVRI